MAAPFSAIITVDALVLIVGITEASITRNASTPMTRRSTSTTALASCGAPILAVPTGWKIVVARARKAASKASSSSSRARGPRDQDGTKKLSRRGARKTRTGMLL